MDSDPNFHQFPRSDRSKTGRGAILHGCPPVGPRLHALVTFTCYYGRPTRLLRSTGTDMTKHSLVAAFVALLAGMAGVAAQTYPSRPVTLVVAFAARGAVDTIARILAEHMRTQIGQTIVVENVGGAAGSIGVGRVARAAPDGYTIVAGNWPTHVLNGAIYSLNYDVLKDFEPISLVATESIVIVGRKDFPAAGLKDLIAWLRANPDKASAGTVGPGSVGHIVGLFFQKETGTRFTFVPYRGVGPAIQDMIA